MIKKVKIFNRFHMDNFVKTGGLNFPYYGQVWYLISIYGHDGVLLDENAKRILTEMGCRGFLSLEFWDIVEKEFESVHNRYPDASLFSNNQAKQVVEFLGKIQKEKGEDSILVTHCHAGISRSGAIGTFTNDYCELDYDAFLKENPSIIANQYVLRLLKKAAGIIPSFGWHEGVDENKDDGIIVPLNYKKE